MIVREIDPFWFFGSALGMATLLTMLGAAVRRWWRGRRWKPTPEQEEFISDCCQKTIDHYDPLLDEFEKLEAKVAERERFKRLANCQHPRHGTMQRIARLDEEICLDCGATWSYLEARRIYELTQPYWQDIDWLVMERYKQKPKHVT